MTLETFENSSLVMIASPEVVGDVCELAVTHPGSVVLKVAEGLRSACPDRVAHLGEIDRLAFLGGEGGLPTTLVECVEHGGQTDVTIFTNMHGQLQSGEYIVHAASGAEDDVEVGLYYYRGGEWHLAPVTDDGEKLVVLGEVVGDVLNSAAHIRPEDTVRARVAALNFASVA